MGLFQSPQNVETNKMCPWEVKLKDGTKVTVNNRLDCIGDTCPRPQLKLKKSIKGMESGEIVEVLINNPPSLETLHAICPEIGATLLDSLKETNLWKLYIQKD
jgi:Predicted redox protein, regulator of disulfide bond formation